MRSAACRPCHHVRSPTPNALELQRRVRAPTTPQPAAKRAQLVLLAADGVPNRQIAPMVGINQHPVASGGAALRPNAQLASRTASGRAVPWSTTMTSGCGSWPP